MEFHSFSVNEVLRLATRKWIFDYIPKNKVWAEVGVFRGHFSDMIHHLAQPSKLYLVDPWQKLGKYFGFNSPYDDFGKLSTAFAKEEVENRAKLYKCKTIIVEQFSLDFCKRIKEKVDVIYLDSSHNYEMTLKELPALASILKDDGFLCGDDWHYYPSNRHHGVFRAIHEFIKENNFQVIAAGPGKQWILKRAPEYDSPVTKK